MILTYCVGVVVVVAIAVVVAVGVVVVVAIAVVVVCSKVAEDKIGEAGGLRSR